MKPIRVYADTSVFGGVFDPPFSRPSSAFFDLVRTGRFQLAVSALVREEARRAPDHVRDLFMQLEPQAVVIDPTAEALALRQAYLTAGIVTPSSSADALHVALATTGSCRMVVSWNFRHIVHAQKMPLYNGVNMASGYSPLAIHSPPEVLTYEPG